MKEGMRGVVKEMLADKPLDFENLLSPANGAHDWLGWSNMIDMTVSIKGLKVPSAKKNVQSLVTKSVNFSHRTSI